MKTLRTPDERLENLADFPNAPNNLEVDDGDGGRLRMHYMDEGHRDGDLIMYMPCTIRSNYYTTCVRVIGILSRR